MGNTNSRAKRTVSLEQPDESNTKHHLCHSGYTQLLFAYTKRKETVPWFVRFFSAFFPSSSDLLTAVTSFHPSKNSVYLENNETQGSALIVLIFARQISSEEWIIHGLFVSCGLVPMDSLSGSVLLQHFCLLRSMWWAAWVFLGMNHMQKADSLFFHLVFSLDILGSFLKNSSSNSQASFSTEKHHKILYSLIVLSHSAVGLCITTI